MKALKIIAAISIVIATTACENSQTKDESSLKTVTVNGTTTSTFKVWGNCEMCKETIEGALKVDGVSKADWNVETKVMTVSYDTTKISLDQIMKYIAGVGYDTEKYKSDDKTYSNLPGCCQYERK